MLLNYDDLNSLYPIRLLLSDLGINKISESSSGFKFSSPFREDKNPSAVLFKNSLYCIDYSGGFSGSIFSLVKEITGENLFSYIGIDKGNIRDFLFKNTVNRKVKKEKDYSSFPVISEKKAVLTKGIIYDDFDTCPNEIKEYLRFRSITKEFIEEFKLGWTYHAEYNNDEEVPFKNRLIIPIYEKGIMLSVEGRDYTFLSKKKTLYPRGGTVNTLFNIDNLDKNSPLIIVEGIMDLIKIWKYFTKNVTCTFGIHLTDRQKTMINEFKEVILFSDGDEAGKKMIYSFYDSYNGNFEVARILGKDPGKASKKETEIALSNTTNIIDFIIDESELFERKNYEW